MNIVRYRYSKKSILKVIFAVIIFLLVLSPMTSLRIQTDGSDGIVSRIVSGSSVIIYENEQNDFSESTVYFTNGIENFIKFFGWSLVPFFILFIPIGIYIGLKKRNYENATLFVIILFSLLPILYAFLRTISETRYFLPLYPILVIFALLAIKEISEKIHNKKVFFTLLVIFLIVSSSIFLHFKMEDVQHEKEALEIAKYVTKLTKVVNGYHPESKYLMVTGFLESKFPVLRSEAPPSVTPLLMEGFSTFEEYMKFGHEFGLTHLVIDESKNQSTYLIDIFNEDKKYPYFTKIFDSSERGYNYHIKIFEIDYEKINFLT